MDARVKPAHDDVVFDTVPVLARHHAAKLVGRNSEAYCANGHVGGLRYANPPYALRLPQNNDYILHRPRSLKPHANARSLLPTIDLQQHRLPAVENPDLL